MGCMGGVGWSALVGVVGGNVHLQNKLPGE